MLFSKLQFLSLSICRPHTRTNDRVSQGTKMDVGIADDQVSKLKFYEKILQKDI